MQMKEKIFTIPVNDAFDSGCECPVCYMKRELENAAVEYTMGPSYMEDDIRAKTDELGFCEKHIKDVYNCIYLYIISSSKRIGLSYCFKLILRYYYFVPEKH